MQAPGRGFGNGFDEGFGQGLAGGPDGSQPHPGVQVTEQSEPGYESRDTDLVSTCSLACCQGFCVCLCNGMSETQCMLCP